MDKIIEVAKTIGVPAFVILGLSIMYIIAGTIGCILDFRGKILPEIINWRRWRRRKKEEKEKQSKLLADVKKSLDEMKAHYSPEKIAERDAWISWVNARAKVYDASVKELTDLKEALQDNNELTLDLYININRNRIIDFASKVVNENVAVSREEFNRIFRVYNDYEDILRKHNKTNGEVEVSIRIIREAYEVHMRNNTFIEDSRGYK
jgi:predicted nucleic acid-binding Zn finger protein